jgi:hypothetical protein
MTAAYFEDHPTDPDKVILRKPPLDQGQDYERGFIDGMQYQMQTSVDKAVNAMTQPTYHIPSKDQRTWVGLTDKDFLEACQIAERGNYLVAFQRIQEWLKEKNS